MTTSLQNASAPCWMGKQDLRDCDYVPLNARATCWMGKQDLSDCDYVSKEHERYLLDGEAGFEGLLVRFYRT